MHLLATCLRDRLRVVSAMGAAARLDPTLVRIGDLSETRVDPFARDLRRNLRRKHGIDCTRALGIWAVFSEEPPLAPQTLAYDNGAFRCVCPGGHNGVNDCEHKHRVEGSTAFVPAAFGAACASVAIKLLLGLPLPKPIDPGAPGPRRPEKLAAVAK
jgi:tRNA A37 threonylcarbamoyladenosine dehydratase